RAEATAEGRRLTALALRCRDGEPGAREALALASRRFVGWVVGRYHAALVRRPESFDRDDLVAEGMVGVLEAADRYDGSTAFTTYASEWILCRVRRYLARQTAAVTIIEPGFYAALAAECGRAPAAGSESLAAPARRALDCLSLDAMVERTRGGGS